MRVDVYVYMCILLHSVITKVVENISKVTVPQDTVIEELKQLAEKQKIEDKELALAMAVYMLGFGSYSGFKNKQEESI